MNIRKLTAQAEQINPSAAHCRKNAPDYSTKRRRAVRQLEREGHGRYPAEHATDVVLAAIEKPDKEMLDAGAGELEHALPKGAKAGYRKKLALVIWRAMFARVRQ